MPTKDATKVRQVGGRGVASFLYTMPSAECHYHKTDPATDKYPSVKTAKGRRGRGGTSDGSLQMLSRQIRTGEAATGDISSPAAANPKSHLLITAASIGVIVEPWDRLRLHSVMEAVLLIIQGNQPFGGVMGR